MINIELIKDAARTLENAIYFAENGAAGPYFIEQANAVLYELQTCESVGITEAQAAEWHTRLVASESEARKLSYLLSWAMTYVDSEDLIPSEEAIRKQARSALDCIK
jgi:hypothetical protein